MRFDRSLYGRTTNFGRRRHKDLQVSEIRFWTTEYKREDRDKCKTSTVFISAIVTTEDGQRSGK